MLRISGPSQLAVLCEGFGRRCKCEASGQVVMRWEEGGGGAIDTIRL